MVTYYIDKLGRHHGGYEYLNDGTIKCKCGKVLKRTWLSIYDWIADCECGLKYGGID
jgi:hypothetical protein